MPMADKFLCAVCKKLLPFETNRTGYIIRQCDDHPNVPPLGVDNGVERSTEPFATKVGHEGRVS